MKAHCILATADPARKRTELHEVAINCNTRSQTASILSNKMVLPTGEPRKLHVFQMALLNTPQTSRHKLTQLTLQQKEEHASFSAEGLAPDRHFAAAGARRARGALPRQPSGERSIRGGPRARPGVSPSEQPEAPPLGRRKWNQVLRGAFGSFHGIFGVQSASTLKDPRAFEGNQKRRLRSESSLRAGSEPFWAKTSRFLWFLWISQHVLRVGLAACGSHIVSLPGGRLKPNTACIG